MILESIEMLHYPYPVEERAYTGESHINHPCSIWARACEENYEWLIDHTLALCEEYTYRYGKIHKWDWIAQRIADSYSALGLPRNGEITPFHQAMPDELKEDDVVAAYKSYYFDDKPDFAYWRKTRPAPEWWLEGAPIWWIQRETQKAEKRKFKNARRRAKLATAI